MNFLQDIVSVLPTIAGVIAPLFNSKKDDYVRYSLSSGSNVYFRKDENDQVWAYNPFNEPIALVFPDKNGIGGETVEIPETSHCVVTSMMTQRAAANVDSFHILKGGVLGGETANLSADDNAVATISASGKVENKAQQSKIGTALSVKIDGDDLSVIVTPPYELDGIVSLEISGDNDEPCRLFKNEPNDGSIPTPVAKGVTSPLEMRFPGALEKFGDSKKLFVSISANCSCPVKSLKEHAARLGRKTQESDWDFLKTGRCLND